MSYSWIYVIVNAFSAVLRQISGDFISPALLLLCSCYLAVCYFHLVNLHEVRRIYKQCWQHKSTWVSLSILVACIWLAAIYSPGYIGASLYTFLFFATNGMLGMASRYSQGTHKSISHAISLFGLLALMIVVVVISNLQHTAHQSLGIVLAIFGGISGFVYSKQSSRFMKTAHLSASQVLAVRFYLTIVICLFLLPQHAVAQLTMPNIFLALMVSIFCLIIPLYFVQKGIEKAGPELNAIIASTVPLAATILEEAYLHNVNQRLFMVCLLYSFLTCLPYLTGLWMRINSANVNASVGKVL